MTETLLPLVVTDEAQIRDQDLKDRLANVHFTQDMLPETEGF